MSDSARASIAAVIQMTSTNDWRSNLSLAIELMTQAQQKDHAELLVLPENVLCFGAAGYADLAAHSEQCIDALANFARHHGVAIVAGSVPCKAHPEGSLHAEGSTQAEGATVQGKYYSRSMLFDSLGRMSAGYDKIHLFDVDVVGDALPYRESERFESGEDLVVSPISGWQLGMTICYDLRFPELFQALRAAGAELISVPAAFTAVTGKAHWEVLLRARAIETQCYVLAANQYGEHAEGRQTWGQSMIVSPWGEILAQCEPGQGYAVACLDAGLMQDVRRDMPLQQHKRLF